MNIDNKRVRTELLARQQTLRDDIVEGAEAAATVELDQSRVGRLSRMDALQGQAMSQEAKRRREQELQQIALALKRLDEGEYGCCIECGEVIIAQRLAVDPAAALCIDCASQLE